MQPQDSTGCPLWRRVATPDADEDRSGDIRWQVAGAYCGFQGATFAALLALAGAYCGFQGATFAALLALAGAFCGFQGATYIGPADHPISKPQVIPGGINLGFCDWHVPSYFAQAEYTAV
jgi:prepilin-type processing-associated H-X9-DG protein